MKVTIVALTFILLGATRALAADACDYGKPHADAPPELSQYAFLIGDFRIEARVWKDGAWSQGFRAARWNGRYILGGMAIMDEWFDFAPEEKPGTGRGVNVRMFNPDTGRWHLMWQHTKDKQVVELSSQLGEDGKMRLEWVPPKPERKVFFETYGPDHWARLDHRKSEETGQWTPRYKLEAFRVPCKE